MQYNSHQSFQIKVSIWDRDIKGLFAYDCNQLQVKTKSFNIKNHCRIYRNNIHNENYFRPVQCVLDQNYTFVCQVDREDNPEDPYPNCCLRVKQPDQNFKQTAKNTPYIVLKKNKRQTLPLNAGDTLKFGTVQYTVMQVKTNQKFQSLFQKDMAKLKYLGQIYQLSKPLIQNQYSLKKKNNSNLKQKKIKKKDTAQKKIIKSKAQNYQQKRIRTCKLLNDQNINQNSQNQQEIQNEIQVQKFINQIQIQQSEIGNQNTIHLLKSQKPIQNLEKKEQQIKCKICYLNQQSEQDPFVSPCKCKGSCESIHVQCLMQWIATKTTKQTKNGVTKYRLVDAFCQICNFPYPRVLKIDNKIIPLVNVQIPLQTPYIILQNTNIQQKQSKDREIIVIEETGRKATIGRSNQQDLTISDISVSRHHAQIFYALDDFYIRDANSKFGTLFQIQVDLKFKNQTVTIQIGRCNYEIKALPIMKFQQPGNWQEFD